jgi:hypothetical protein
VPVGVANDAITDQSSTVRVYYPAEGSTGRWLRTSGRSAKIALSRATSEWPVGCCLPVL